MLAHSIQREKLFKVHTPELWPTINRDGCRKSAISLDTQPHHHHTRAVGRRVKSQIECSNASGIGENHEGEPAFPQELVRLRIAELEIDFQMVDVRHRPGVAPMPPRGFFSWVVVLLEGVSGSRTFTCQYLLIHGFVALCSRVKGSLGNRWQVFLLGPRDVLAVAKAAWFGQEWL